MQQQFNAMQCNGEHGAAVRAGQSGPSVMCDCCGCCLLTCHPQPLCPVAWHIGDVAAIEEPIAMDPQKSGFLQGQAYTPRVGATRWYPLLRRSVVKHPTVESRGSGLGAYLGGGRVSHGGERVATL